MSTSIIISPEEAEKEKQEKIAAAIAAITVADYDRELETYLLEVRTERGYTSRDPSEYYNSSNARWSQDAKDWLDFRDRVMTYGLEVENQYEQAGTAPCTLDEFKTNLRTIKCNWTYEVEG